MASKTSDLSSNGASLKPLVMVKKTGIVPRGLVNVKKEVKHKSA